MLILTSHLVEDLLVEGLEEAHVVVGHADALALGGGYGLGCQVAYGADAEYGDVVTVV